MELARFVELLADVFAGLDETPDTWVDTAPTDTSPEEGRTDD